MLKDNFFEIKKSYIYTCKYMSSILFNILMKEEIGKKLDWFKEGFKDQRHM